MNTGAAEAGQPLVNLRGQRKAAAAGRDLPQVDRDHIYGRWVSICEKEGYPGLTR